MSRVLQVASRALKIPTSKIHISETSTNTVPNTSPTAASASADINGQAVYVSEEPRGACTAEDGLWIWGVSRGPLDGLEESLWLSS